MSEIIFILLAFALPALATVRAWTKRNSLLIGIERTKIDAADGYLGTLIYAAMVLSLVLVWSIVIFTFLFMRSGAASGIPLAIVIVGFPFFWLFLEVLTLVLLKRKDTQRGNAGL